MANGMSAKLKITWEGTVPGLAEHRLSLGAFAESLHLLVVALRRIATNHVNIAVEERADKSTGRFTDIARGVDIQIGAIVEGSAGISGDCVFNPQSATEAFLFSEQLIEETTDELLTGIQQESKGYLKNAAIRKYLQSLPAGLIRQTYDLRGSDGTSRKSFVIESMDIQAVPDDLPFLCELTGSVVGVGFEPGRPEVRIKQSDTPPVALLATSEQVEVALSLRHEEVRTLSVKGRQHKLLRLQKTDAPAVRVTSDYVTKHLFGHWDALLRRLAE